MLGWTLGWILDLVMRCSAQECLHLDGERRRLGAADEDQLAAEQERIVDTQNGRNTYKNLISGLEL